MRLVLGERKSVNTLTYMMLVAMAYFGPNAELMGNIKLEIWHFKKPIMDIEAYLIKVSLLMAVDLFSVVVNGALLWHFCKINVVKVMKKLQQKFWLPFTIVEGFLLMSVINSFFYLRLKQIIVPMFFI